MEIFTTLLIVLFVVTAIYYVVYFSLIYYWHEAKLSFIVLPAMSTFEFFIVGFLVVAIISILINYLPEVLNAFNIKWL